MNANLDTLPHDMLRKTLFKLKVKDVLNYCQHSTSAYNLCNAENFWQT